MPDLAVAWTCYLCAPEGVTRWSKGDRWAARREAHEHYMTCHYVRPVPKLKDHR